MKKKPVQIPDRIADRLVYLKYVILVIIVFMCYGGVYSKHREQVLGMYFHDTCRKF